jgi:uncharacterized membrane protein YfcA
MAGLPLLDDIWLLPLIAAIAFLGSLIYGMTGFGSALVTIPLATHFVPLPFALAVFSLVDLSSALRIGLQKPKDAVKAEIMRMVPFALVGTVIGITVLVNLPRARAMFALGVFVLLYAVYALFSRPGTTLVSRHWAYLAGILGGSTGTVFGAGGPPYAIYLSHRPLTKEQFRATLTLTTVFSIGMRVTAFAITGLIFKAEVGVAAAFSVLAAMVGLSLASWAFTRVTREVVLRAVAVMLLANGISLIVRAAG